MDSSGTVFNFLSSLAKRETGKMKVRGLELELELKMQSSYHRWRNSRQKNSLACFVFVAIVNENMGSAIIVVM